MDLTNQVLLNRYHVGELIGRGGMADVYKAWDTRHGCWLALKLLREDLAQDRVFLKRFQREAQYLARLKHQNIVRYYRLVEDGLLVFMLVDYIDGVSLRTCIFQEQHLPQQQIIQVMSALCDALHYAHSLGIVHCDVKPANILIDQNGKVWLTDFGIARMVDTSTSSLSTAGTAAYMAPEQVMGKTPTPRADIYAIGIVLYEMLAGVRPFTGEQAAFDASTNDKIRWEQVHAAPPPVSRYAPGVSAALEQVISRCLEKDPYRRYPTTRELFKEFSKAISVDPTWVVEDGTGTTTRTQVIDRSLEDVEAENGDRRRKVASLFGGLAAFGLLVVAIFIGLPWAIDHLGSVPALITPPPIISVAPPLPITEAPQSPIITVAPPPITVMPQATTYNLMECMAVLLGGANQASLCIISATIHPDGRMQFNVQWTVNLASQTMVIMYPTQKGEVYLIDDLGNRYDYIDLGGDANVKLELQNGQNASGWYLFEQAAPQAKHFIFYDDGNKVQSHPIPRQWP